MAVDSDDKDYAINKTYWDSRIDSIANKEEVKEQGYFFGIEEARIHKEGSLVLVGSNDATEIIYPKDESNVDPPEGSQQKDNTDPPNGSQDENIYKFLITNLKSK